MTGCVRAAHPPQPMDARDIDREARAVWEVVAEAAGDRKGLPGIVARTYNLCRDLQRAAASGRVRFHVLMSVVDLFARVVRSSCALQGARV